MSQLFSESGQSEDIGVSAPTLQNQFIPAMDKAEFVDGFRIIIPLGGGKTQRNFVEYGLSAEVSSQETQINDLSSLSLTPASYSFEGLVGPQGRIGPKGDPGKVIVQQILYPFTGLVSLDDTLQQIEELGATIANAGDADKLIYVSSITEQDAELSWTERQPVGDSNQYWRCVASDSDGSNLIAAANTGRLYTSNDSGATWTERKPAGDASKNWTGVASDSDGSNLIACIFSGRLYTSSDSGVNWTERRPSGDYNRTWACVASDSDGSFLVAATHGTGASYGRLFTSNDGGANWTERQPAGNYNRAWESVASNLDGSVLVAVTVAATFGYGRVHISTDSGVNWNEVQPAGDTDLEWYDVDCDSTGAKIVVVDWGTRIYRSTDYGANWLELRPNGDDDFDWMSIASSSDGTVLIAGIDNGRLYISRDSGATWEEEQPAGVSDEEWWSVDIDSDGSNFIVGNQGGRLYTGIYSAGYYEETWSSADLTSFARSLLDDADATSARTTLGLGSEDVLTLAGLIITESSGLTITGLSGVLKAVDGIIEGNAELDDIYDVNASSPTKNHCLKFNGSEWVSATYNTSFTFSIATFTYSGYTSILEMGVDSSEWKAIGDLSFTATYNNGPPDATPYINKTSLGWTNNLEMTEDGYVGPTLNTEAVNYPSAVNGNRQFILYAASGDENDTETKTVYFRNKKYFGFHSTTGQLDSDETKVLSNNAFVAASGNDLDTSATNLTPSGSQYIHFVYPSRLDPSTIKFYLGGFETDFTDNGTFTFTNASGFEETYRDYESPQAYDAATELVVSATP